MKQQLNLMLKNNTPYVQTVQLFDPEQPLAMSAGGSGWNGFFADISQELATAATFNNKTIVLIGRPAASNGPWTIYQVTNATYFANIQQVVDALNSLNIAEFFSPGGNTLGTYSFTFRFLGIFITNLFTSVTATATNYTQNGSLIYDPGFNINGVGNFTRISTLNPFWINGGLNTIDGPMNRNSIWNNAIPLNQQVGFITQIQSATAKQVYIGIGTDGSASPSIPSIYLNGATVLSSNSVLMGNNIATILSTPGYNTPSVTYLFWNIFPVLLQVGTNILQVENANAAGNGGLAIEVYDNTAAEIAAATSYSGLTVLFKSADYVGQYLF